MHFGTGFGHHLYAQGQFQAHIIFFSNPSITFCLIRHVGGDYNKWVVLFRLETSS